MTNVLRKVKSGDPLKIPAATFNTFVDSARDYLQRQQGAAQKPTQAFRQTGIVPVKNGSGTDAARFAVLGIDGPIFTPTDSLDSFKNTIALKGITPAAASHAGKFAILQEPVATVPSRNPGPYQKHRGNGWRCPGVHTASLRQV